MFLIDSDILVFLLRGNERVSERFAAHAADPKALSVISYGELLYGAIKSARPVENTAKVRRIAELLPMVDVSPAVMETFASLKAEMEQHGKKVDDFDLIIASTAVHLSYTLVTNNVRHFREIPGLAVENWAKSS
jgi:tRNA(fMet)-specific endonuclease VapC